MGNGADGEKGLGLVKSSLNSRFSSRTSLTFTTPVLIADISDFYHPVIVIPDFRRIDRSSYMPYHLPTQVPSLGYTATLKM